MSKFVLTAQLQLQAPTNTQQVINQIRGQLQGAINIPVNVQGSVQAAKQINQVNQAAQKATTAGERMGKAFGASIKRFAAFNIATRAVGLFASKLSQAVDESIKFQRELVKISQVTGKTTGELQGLTDTITRLSTTLGVSSTSLLQTGRILAQAGIQAGDLKVALQALAKTTLAPTFDDITETAEGAVAILAQFGEGVGALEKQLGAINAVAGKFAVESADLISVVRRTGGVFRQAGGDLNELLALFTSVRATTRENAESIATGLRTIFTRIQRPQTIEYLKQFGVQLTDLNGRFVGPYEAVRQLSAALAGLAQGDIRFVQIAEELGGFRQIGKVIPLIQKFEVAERARQAAIAGGNSLTKDAETAQEALAVQIEKTREKFLALIRSISETSTFQIMIKSLLGIANAFIKVAESIKPLLPLIAAFAAVKFTRGLGTFVSGIGAGLRGKNQGGKIHAFASGGFVPGTGNRDTVPAMLTPGEFVIRKSSVNKIGTGTLTAMNTKGYKDGGLVEINPNASGKAIQVIVNERSNVADASAIPPISINLPQGKDSPAKQFSSEALKIAGIDKLGFSTPLTVSGFNDSNFEKAKLSIQDTINNTIDSLSEQAKAIGGSGINLKKTKEKIKKSFRTGIGRIFEEYITDLARIDSPGSRNFDILPVTDPAKKNKIGGLSTIEAYNPSNYGEIKLQESVGQFQDIIKKAANQGFFNEAIKKRIPRKRSGDGEQKAAAPKTNKALGGKIHQFATGGFVPGTGNRDTVPAMLTPGEFVIRKSSVNKIGVDNLAAMNVKGYNGGGYISALSGAGRPTSQFKRYLQDVQGFSNSEARSDKIAASVAEEYKQDFEKWQDAQKKVKADKIRKKEAAQVAALKQEFPGGVFKTIPGTIGAFYLNPAQGKDDAFASRSRREFKLNGQDAVLLSGSQASGFSPGKRDLEKSSALAGMVRTNVQSAIDKGLRSIVPNFANTLDVGPIDVQSTQFEESIHRASTDKNIVSTTSGFMFEGIIDAITGAAIKGGRANFDFNRSSIQAGESKLNQMFGSDAVGALYAADAKFSAARRTDVFKKAVNSIKNGNGNLIGTAIQQFATGGTVGPQKFAEGGKVGIFDSDYIAGATKDKNSILDAILKTGTVRAAIWGAAGSGKTSLAKSRYGSNFVTGLDDLSQYTGFVVLSGAGSTKSGSQVGKASTRFSKTAASSFAAAAKIIAVLPNNLEIAKRRATRASSAVALGDTRTKEQLAGTKHAPGTDYSLASELKRFGKPVEIIGGPKRKKMATGGAVGTDTVPAMLTPGEFVINKKAAQSIGYGNLNRMNKQGVVGYAKGGPVQHFAGGGMADSMGSAGGLVAFSLLSTSLSQMADETTEFGKTLNKVNQAAIAVGSTMLLVSTIQKAGAEAISKFANAGKDAEEKLKKLSDKKSKQTENQAKGKEVDLNLEEEIQELEKIKPALEDTIAKYKEAEQYSKDFVKTISDNTGFTTAIKNFQDSTGWLAKLGSVVESSVVVPVKTALIPAWHGLKKAILSGIAPFKAAGDAFKAAGGGLKGATSAAWAFVKTPFTGTASAIKSLDSSIRKLGVGASQAIDKLNQNKGIQRAAQGITFFASVAQQAGQAVADYANEVKQSALDSGNFDEARMAGQAASVGEGVAGVGAAAATGAALGSVFGPVGTVVGGVVGAGAGLIQNWGKLTGSTEKLNKEIADAALAYNKQKTEKTLKDFDEGGGLFRSMKGTSAASNELAHSISRANADLKQQMDQEGVTDEQRKASQEQMTAAEVEAARRIGATNLSQAEFERQLKILTENTTGNAQAEREAALSARQLMLAQQALTRVNLDALEASSYFGASMAIAQGRVDAFDPSKTSQDINLDILKSSQDNIGLTPQAQQATQQLRAQAMRSVPPQLRGVAQRSFDRLEQSNIARQNIGNLAGANLAAGGDERKQQITSILTQGLSGDQADIVSGALEELDGNFSNLDQVIEKVQSALKESDKAALAFAEGLQQRDKMLRELTKERIQQEQEYADARKHAIDVEIEAAKIREEFGGRKVTARQKANAETRKLNIDLEKTGVQLQTGSVQEVSQAQAALAQQGIFNRGQRQAAIVRGGGSVGDLSQDQQDAIEKQNASQKAILEYSRSRVALIKEEIDIAKKKNALEKSSYEKLIGGDVLGFIEGQQAKIAQDALLRGDVATAQQLGPKATQEAFQNIKEFGTTQEKELAGKTAARASGLTPAQAAQAGMVLADQTPEVKALEAEGRMFADIMERAAQAMAAMEEKDIQIANAKIIITGQTFGAGVPGAQATASPPPNAFGRPNAAMMPYQPYARGGVVYANRGIFVPRGTDTVPAMLTPGEFVVNRAAVQRGNNLAILHAMNNGQQASGPAMARGGTVRYYHDGDHVSGGGMGISTEVANKMSSSLSEFAKAVDKLLDFKLTVKLDPTLVTVNLAGTSFLGKMKDDIKKELFAVIGNKMNNMSFTLAGDPNFNEGMS